jgi:ubiquinone/menaquinone biosynthesis C-methylase UbiE
MDTFEKQYNKTAGKFNEFYDNQEAHVSTDAFFSVINSEIISSIENKNILDLGCGAGKDSIFYVQRGFTYSGVDASAEMCALAKQDKNVSDIRNETFSQRMSFEDNKFGLVVSKYAMQTALNIEPIYEEVSRILDDRGYFIFLVVHPMRQFIEKKKKGKDYFKKELVKSVIFDGKITVEEASHTISEYLNYSFLSRFILVDLKEGYDFPASEQINGDTYPTFLIISAQKK